MYRVSESLSLLLYQYQHSARLIALLRSLLAEYEVLDATAEDLRTRLDIDLSRGVQLDGIGEIVGRPRPNTEQIDPDDVFAFDGGLDGKGFSGEGRPDIGGRFQGRGGLIIGPMPDDNYRILIRATIFGNYADSTVDDLAEYVRFVIGDYPSIVPYVGYVDVTFPRPLSLVELSIIDQAFPIAAGIRIRYQSFTQGPGGFGFAGGPNAGFGAVDVPQVGAGFAGLLETT